MYRLVPNRHSFAARGAPAAARGAMLALGVVLAWPSIAQTPLPAPRVASDVKDIRFVPLAALPAAGGSADDRSGCPQLLVRPASAGARRAAAQGWAVLSDLPLGTYRVVSFAGKLDVATSGTCNVTQGNVAVFDRDRLVALAYGKSAGDTAIGKLTPLEGGAVRVWDGDIVESPVGDLHVDADGTLRLGKVAGVDSVCGGRASVPSVYHLPIDKARKLLAANGWKPVRAKARGDSRQAELIRYGVVEAGDCSGTGLGYCGFDYTGPAGALFVTTAGEGDFPSVVDYRVRCR